MIVFFLSALFFFLVGVLLSSYCRLALSLWSVSDSWNLLMTYALKKREALVSLCRLSENHWVRERYLPLLLEEIAFIEKYQGLQKKFFLQLSREIVPMFFEMESDFLSKTQQFYAAIKEEFVETFHEEFCSLSENFVAADNLFAFESLAYEQTVRTYEEMRSKPSLQLAKEIFRFSSIPEVHFCR